jgi:selenocysteine lyase/cysteine desulfurase
MDTMSTSTTIGSIRDDFPMLANWRHFNCGGMAPLSKSVGAELLRVPQEVIADGPGRLLAHDDDFLQIEAARARLARFVGADLDEIAFTTQFSTAASIVIEGLDWKEGDEILVTNQEHPALLIPLANMARRRGLVIKRMTVSHSADEMLASFRELLSSRTRLVAVSHVTTDSGDRLPAEEITKLAHDQGALVLFDGAHSLGQFPIDLHALGCDFYAMVGYKWVLGPYPSAALYIRRDRLDEVDVTWCGSGMTTGGSVTMGVEDLHWVPGARRFELGGRTFSYDTAMATGIAYVENLGLDAVQAHARALTAQFHDGLARIPGSKIESPTDLNDTNAIATASFASVGGAALSAALRDRFRIIQRPALRATSVRFSLAPFIEPADVDFLLESIATVVAGE